MRTRLQPRVVRGRGAASAQREHHTRDGRASGEDAPAQPGIPRPEGVSPTQQPRSGRRRGNLSERKDVRAELQQTENDNFQSRVWPCSNQTLKHPYKVLGEALVAPSSLLGKQLPTLNVAFFSPLETWSEGAHLGVQGRGGGRGREKLKRTPC